MSWEARSTTTSLGIGTVFHLMETPQIPGHSSNVTPGDRFHIIDVHDKWTEMNVLSATSNLIVLTSGATGEMHLSPIGSEELGSNIHSPGMVSSDWKRIA